MQCPSNEKARESMYEEIRLIDENFDERSAEAPGHALYWLLGKQIGDMEVDKMVQIWAVAGQHISNMYKLRLKSGEGIG